MNDSRWKTLRERKLAEGFTEPDDVAEARQQVALSMALARAVYERLLTGFERVRIVAGIESSVSLYTSVGPDGRKGSGISHRVEELHVVSRAGHMFGVDVTPAKRRERKR